MVGRWTRHPKPQEAVLPDQPMPNLGNYCSPYTTAKGADSADKPKTFLYPSYGQLSELIYVLFLDVYFLIPFSIP